jgi:simple sugar transport system permease protein
MDLSLLDFLASSLRVATPLLFAAMGALISERAGVFAVGLEGMVLAGAFGATAGAFASGSALVGILASMVAGGMVGGIIALVAVRYRAEQIVTGLAANILVIGLTSFLFRLLGRGSAPVIRIPVLDHWRIPGLADLPFVGPLLFDQPPLTYLALGLIVPLSLILTRTRWGLMLRAVGESPTAVFATGARPTRWRVGAVVIGAALAGLGGAVLSLQQVGTFSDGMTSGRGYLALAAIIVGRWTPLGSFIACLVFGASEVLYLQLQMTSLPIGSYTIQMLPYVIALVVLAGLGKSARLPAAIGTPIDPSQR